MNPKELLQPGGVSYDLAATISQLNEFMGERLRTERRRTPAPEELTGEVAGMMDLGADFEPFTVSADKAAQYGFELDEGWHLEVAPDPQSASGVTTTLLSPDGWRVTEAGEYISNEGESYTEEEIQGSIAFGEAAERLFPGQNQADVLAAADAEPEAFFEAVRSMGRNEDTETLLAGFGFDQTQMQQFWSELRPWHVLEEARWHIGDWAIPLWLQAGAQTTLRGFDIVQQYTWQPVEINMAYMNIKARGGIGFSLAEAVTGKRGQLTENDIQFLERMVEIEQKYGLWGAPATNEAAEAWAEWNGIPTWDKTIIEMANPVWLLPVGGTAGLVVKPLAKATYLGTIGKATAKLAQAAEAGRLPAKAALQLAKEGAIEFATPRAARAALHGVRVVETAEAVMGAPVTLPLKAVGYGGKKLISSLRRFSPSMRYIRFDLPKAEVLAKDIVDEDWAHRLVTRLSKVPHAGKVINTFVKGWDPALVARTVPARAMLVGHAVRSTGQQTRNIIVANLKAISADPIKLFRFDANTVSHAPWVKAIKGSGATRTLDDIFTNPLKYKFVGKQGKIAKEYIIASHQIIDDVVKLMKHHGIKVPEKYFPPGSHWFRRHVIATQFGKEPLQTTGRAKALGSTPSMFKHRTVEDTFQAISEGIQYMNNPEVLVGEVYEQAFNLLAQQYVQKLMMPKSIQRIALARKEVKQLSKFLGMIDDEIRGARAKPEQAAAFKRQYPDLAGQFEKARQMPTGAEQQVADFLTARYGGTPKPQAATAARPIERAPGEAAPGQVARFKKNRLNASLDEYAERTSERRGKLHARYQEAEKELADARARGAHDETRRLKEEMWSLDDRLKFAAPEWEYKDIQAGLRDIPEEFRDLFPEASARPITARTEVPFMVTRDMERRLADLGYSAEAISKMKPAEAWEKLGGRPIAARAPAERPSRTILREGLEQMDYSQRVSVRRMSEESLLDAQQAAEKISAEIGAIEEYLSTDAVAQYRSVRPVTRRGGKVTFDAKTGEMTTKGKRPWKKVDLTSVLNVHGEFPETLTRRQAEALLMGRELKPNVLTPEGKVKWEYVLDELAEHFHMSEQELIDSIQYLYRQKESLRNLVRWVSDADEAVKSAEDLIKILDDIDSNAANIGQASPVLEPEPILPATPDVPGAVASEKAPWLMTRQEYEAYRLRLPPEQQPYIAAVDNELGRELYGQEAILYRAVHAGEDIPGEILRPYPEVQQVAFKEMQKRIKPGSVPEEALPEAVQAATREAWQMSWHEFRATNPVLTSKRHRDLIQAALAEGKPVPRRVLVDYPELVSLDDAWWLTSEEWLQGQSRLVLEGPLPQGEAPRYDYFRWRDQHRAVVAKAVQEGKAVPPEVLRDYPELQAMMPEPGAPEAGKQVDIFGNVYEVRPKGKGKVTQISMEEYEKLRAAWKKAGHVGEPPNVQKAPDIDALKQPWKLRRADYAEAVDPYWRMADAPTETAGGRAFYQEHPRQVEEALARGDVVPDEVIADYRRGPLPKDTPNLAQRVEALDAAGKGAQPTAKAAAREAPTEGAAPPAKEPPKPPETAWKSEFDDVPEPRSAALREKKLRNIRSELARRQREASARMALRAGEARLPGPAAKWGAFPQEVVDELRAFYEPQGNAFLQAMSTTSGFMRMFKATMDFSAPSIQGTAILGYAFALLPTRPIVAMRLITAWVKAVGLHIAVAAKPSMFAKWIAKPEVQRSLQQRCVAYGGSHATFEFYDVMGTLMRAAKKFRAVTKIPGGETLIRQTFGRAEASFNFFGEYIRNEFWKILLPAAIKQGRGRQLATLLDRLTGVMSTEAMGLPLWQRQLESGFLFFAPRYIRACLWVVGQVFRGGWTGRQALKALAGIVTVLPTFYWLTCEALGQEPIWDPRSGRFMTVEIAGRHIGPGSFWYGLVRLFADIYVSVAQDQDKPINFWSLHRSSETRDNPFLLFWYNRSAPLTGVLVDVAIEQTTYLGEPLESAEDYAMYALQQFTPIAFNEAFFHDLEWGGEAVSPAMLAGEIFGLRTYPISLREQFYKVAEEYIPKLEEAELHENQLEAWRKGTLKWGDLDTYQKSLLLMRYDDLREADEIATLEALKWRGEDYRAWYFEVTQTKTWMVDEGTRIGTKLLDGVISTRQFRDQVNDMNYAYGAMVNAARNNPRYESIYAQFDRDLSDAAETVDIAYDEYMETIMGGDFEDAYGDFDFDAYNLALRRFREKWGVDMYERVVTIMESNKYDQSPLVVALWKDRRRLWDYWQVEEGDARIAYRIAHPDIDAALLLWGYVAKPRTEEAYRIMIARAKELGIPLSAIAGGIAGGDYEAVEAAGVATDWFRFLALPESGYARARFRVEHRAFDSWGMERYGWEPVDADEIPSEEVERLLVNYDRSNEDARLAMRCKSKELDAWLVGVEGEEAVYGTELCAVGAT